LSQRACGLTVGGYDAVGDQPRARPCCGERNRFSDAAGPIGRQARDRLRRRFKARNLHRLDQDERHRKRLSKGREQRRLVGQRRNGGNSKTMGDERVPQRRSIRAAAEAKACNEGERAQWCVQAPQAAGT